MRRAPLQERSAETVHKIDEATSRLLGQGVSVEELTTSQIAGEAGVSVGALYRFFPDKQAIVDSLALRRLGEFQEGLLAELAPCLFSSTGPALLGRVIDAFVAFLDANPDFRTLAYGGRHISRGAREENASQEGGATVLVKRFMIDVLGVPDTPDLDLKLRVAVEAGDGLLAFALEQKDRARRAAVIGEMKRMLSTYLFG
ncbi:MAG: TetR family transcriptional regulator [Methylobacteriaceae bacterium]|nr:TetR family transcriptional regulator [Methylobacteriaceae bacterium]